MILVTHAVIGTALTHRIYNYFTVFLVGILSHYAADMIPHWHYRIPHVKRAVTGRNPQTTLSFKAKFLPDFFKIFIDALLGLIISLSFFSGDSIGIALGVVGAILPDFLVGLYRFYPSGFLRTHHLFHHWIHTTVLLDEKPLLGVTSQAALIGITIWVGR